MSLKDTYQSRKNLLAQNLTAMGVTASGTEGLTTLINKVLDIPTIETYNLTLSTNKNIISQAHSESAILTITVTNNQGQAVADKTVTILKNGVYYTSATTNSSGIATITYNSQATGDIQFIANINDNISNSVLVEDCFYFNDGTINDIAINSGTSVTIENGAIKITKSSNGEHKWYFPTLRKFTTSENIAMILESAREDETGQIAAVSINPSLSASTQGYAGYWTSNNQWDINFGDGSVGSSINLQKGDIITFSRENGYTKLYHNGVLQHQYLRSISDYYMGGYTNQNRIQRWKNIKIKAITV